MKTRNALGTDRVFSLFTEEGYMVETVGASLSSITKMLSGVIRSNGIGPAAYVAFIDALAKLLEAQDIKT